MLRRFKQGVVRIAFAVSVVLFLYGVMAAQDVSTEYVPGTDFSKFKSYKWVNIQGGEHPDQILDQQIRNAVDGQLAAKGMIKTDNDPADMYVSYEVAITQNEEWIPHNKKWRLEGMPTVPPTIIQIGTLDLDFYDPAAEQLVWEGRATKTLNPSKDPQKTQDRLNKAVAKLLKGFPPQPRK